MRNDLSVEIFSSGTTPIVDAGDDFRNFEQLQFSTGYPGGLSLSASLRVPRSIVHRG